MENQSPQNSHTPNQAVSQVNQELQFTPLHAYIKEQFGDPREAAKQFQEIMDEMVHMATMKDEYVCLLPFRFATMYGHLQLLRDALEECAARNTGV